MFKTPEPAIDAEVAQDARADTEVENPEVGDFEEAHAAA